MSSAMQRSRPPEQGLLGAVQAGRRRWADDDLSTEDEEVVWDNTEERRQWAEVIARIPAPPGQQLPPAVAAQPRGVGGPTQTTHATEQAVRPSAPAPSQDDFLQFFPEYRADRRPPVAIDDEPTPPRAKRARGPSPPSRVAPAEDISDSGSENPLALVWQGRKPLGRRGLAEEIEDFHNVTPMHYPPRENAMRRQRTEEKLLQEAAAESLNHNPRVPRLQLSHRKSVPTPRVSKDTPQPRWLVDALEGSRAESAVPPTAVAAALQCFRVEHTHAPARQPTGPLSQILWSVCRDLTRKHTAFVQRQREGVLTVEVKSVKADCGVALCSCAVLQPGATAGVSAGEMLTVVFTHFQLLAMDLQKGTHVDIAQPFSIIPLPGGTQIVVGADFAAPPVSVAQKNPEAAVLQQQSSSGGSSRRGSGFLDLETIENDEWQLDPSLWQQIDELVAGQHTP
eukprot:Hpha_TRINITY_DN3075_c0_g1::TRINITY_DN3075_c0_g1_i1::g.138640::m.138640